MFIARLNNQLSDEFLLKNLSSDLKKEINEFHNLRIKHLQLKCFKYKNRTGMFEVYVYLNKYHNVEFYGMIASNSYVIVGVPKLKIYSNGNVCFYDYDYSLRKNIKTSTGFHLEPKDAETIIDYINELELFSKHLKNKYYSSGE